MRQLVGYDQTITVTRTCGRLKRTDSPLLREEPPDAVGGSENAG